MRDIGEMLETTSKENECSVFNALLILLDDSKEDDVCILQPESEPEPRR